MPVFPCLSLTYFPNQLITQEKIYIMEVSVWKKENESSKKYLLDLYNT